MPTVQDASSLTGSVKPEDAMFPRLLKRTFVALAILLALAFVARWFFHSPSLPVRATFQYLTNDVGSGRVGVVELVNALNETVEVMGAWYVPAKRNDLSVSAETPAASIYGDVRDLAARTTNIVRVSVPTNGGPYRLVFQCVPERTSPQRMEGTLRYRILWKFASWLHPSQATLVRWFNGFFVASQSIDVSL